MQQPLNRSLICTDWKSGHREKCAELAVGAESRAAPAIDPIIDEVRTWLLEYCAQVLPGAMVVALQPVVARTGSVAVIESHALHADIYVDTDPKSEASKFRFGALEVLPDPRANVGPDGRSALQRNIAWSREHNAPAAGQLTFAYFAYNIVVNGEYNSTHSRVLVAPTAWIADIIADAPPQRGWIAGIVRATGGSVAEWSMEKAEPGEYGHAEGFVWQGQRVRSRP